MLDDGSPSPPASKFSHSHPAEAMHESFYIQSVSETNPRDLKVQRVKNLEKIRNNSDIQWSDLLDYSVHMLNLPLPSFPVNCGGLHTITLASGYDFLLNIMRPGLSER